MPHSDALPTQVGLHPDDVTHLEAMVDVEDWIGLRENLQESPVFNGKIYGFLSTFPLNQSNQ